MKKEFAHSLQRFDYELRFSSGNFNLNIKIFTSLVGENINNFNGYFIKFQGDCVDAAYPADQNYTSMCDNAIMTAMTIRNFIDDVINPVFLEKEYLEIGFHIGLDVGTSRVENVRAPQLALFTDLIGYSINLTKKIQGIDGHNEILLSRSLFEMLHNHWQKWCKEKGFR